MSRPERCSVIRNIWIDVKDEWLSLIMKICTFHLIRKIFGCLLYSRQVGEQDILQANIKSAIGGSSEDAIAAIDEKLVELQNELLKQANAKKDYEPIADEIT